MDLIRRLFGRPKKENGTLFEQFYWILEEYEAFDTSQHHTSSRDDMLNYLTEVRDIKTKVLSQIFAIRDEVLPGHILAPRDYRNKFSWEVQQDSQLLGRVWISAEYFSSVDEFAEPDEPTLCLIARHFIFSLRLLCDTLKNHAKQGEKPLTPIVIHALLKFDRIHAIFEQMIIQHSTHTKSEEDFYYIQDLAVLFSSALDEALYNKHVTRDQVESYDPSLILVIPRLGLYQGLTLLPEGPLNHSNFKGIQEHMFKPHHKKIKTLRHFLDQLTPVEEMYLLLKLAGCDSDSDKSDPSPNFCWTSRISHHKKTPPRKTNLPREELIHKLFLGISAVSDTLQSKHAEDLAQILKWVFDMALVHDPVPVERAEEAWPLSACFRIPPQETAEWVPDSSSPVCSQCQTAFTMFLRRHHCRSCGNIYCYKCSSNFVPLPPYPRPVRLCDLCVKLDV